MMRDLQSVEQTDYWDEIIQIFHEGVRKAQAESRALGVANVYSFNGQLYYELPDGEITRTPPDGFERTEP